MDDLPAGNLMRSVTGFEQSGTPEDVLQVAAVRFGDAVAGRVEDLLRATEDWDELAAAAELIVRAETGPGLIDGIGRSIRQSDQRS